MPFIAIVLLIAAALGGGTAVVAQQSLPGDPLWGFKVNVNEGVGAVLSSSGRAKADWNIASIQTRLAEAQALDAQGKLNAGTQTDIAANVEEHARGVQDAIDKLKAAGDAPAAADAAARFQAVAERFVSLTGGAQTSPLSESARNLLTGASQLSAQTSIQVQTTGGAQNPAGAGAAADTTVNAGASTSAQTPAKPSIQSGEVEEEHGVEIEHGIEIETEHGPEVNDE